MSQTIDEITAAESHPIPWSDEFDDASGHWVEIQLASKRYQASVATLNRCRLEGSFALSGGGEKPWKTITGREVRQTSRANGKPYPRQFLLEQDLKDRRDAMELGIFGNFATSAAMGRMGIKNYVLRQLAAAGAIAPMRYPEDSKHWLYPIKETKAAFEARKAVRAAKVSAARTWCDRFRDLEPSCELVSMKVLAKRIKVPLPTVKAWVRMGKLVPTTYVTMRAKKKPSRGRETFERPFFDKEAKQTALSLRKAWTSGPYNTKKYMTAEEAFEVLGWGRDTLLYYVQNPHPHLKRRIDSPEPPAPGIARVYARKDIKELATRLLRNVVKAMKKKGFLTVRDASEDPEINFDKGTIRGWTSKEKHKDREGRDVGACNYLESGRLESHVEKNVILTSGCTRSVRFVKRETLLLIRERMDEAATGLHIDRDGTRWRNQAAAELLGFPVFFLTNNRNVAQAELGGKPLRAKEVVMWLYKNTWGNQDVWVYNEEDLINIRAGLSSSNMSRQLAVHGGIGLSDDEFKHLLKEGAKASIATATHMPGHLDAWGEKIIADVPTKMMEALPPPDRGIEGPKTPLLLPPSHYHGFNSIPVKRIEKAIRDGRLTRHLVGGRILCDDAEMRRLWPEDFLDDPPKTA